MADKILDIDCSLKQISSSTSLNLEGKYSSDRSNKLRCFLQLQVEQLAVQSAITWAQITYIDPLSRARSQVVQTAEPLRSPDILAKLGEKIWSLEFSPFLLHEIIGNRQEKIFVYYCRYGCWQQECQDFLVVAEDPLSLSCQHNIQQTAVLVSEYLELYLEYSQQQYQTQVLEQIIQRVGHQLRHQLSLIGLCAENLCRSLRQGASRKRAATICETAQYLDRNLTELIYYGSYEKLRFTLEDLRCLVIESIQGFQAWITEKQLQVCYPETSVNLSFDHLQMRQVLDNLLSNAIHFSPLGSAIAINWQVFPSEVQISIADQGRGLSPEDLQKLFTPFYSRRDGGIGLGLIIAQKVVLAHQGKLWAKNLPVKGAEFLLTLPRSITSI